MASYAEYTWLKAHRRMDGKGKDPRGCGNMVARNLPTALCLSRGPLLGCEETVISPGALESDCFAELWSGVNEAFRILCFGQQLIQNGRIPDLTAARATASAAASSA